MATKKKAPKPKPAAKTVSKKAAAKKPEAPTVTAATTEKVTPAFATIPKATPAVLAEIRRKSRVGSAVKVEHAGQKHDAVVIGEEVGLTVRLRDGNPATEVFVKASAVVG